MYSTVSWMSSSVYNIFLSLYMVKLYLCVTVMTTVLFCEQLFYLIVISFALFSSPSHPSPAELAEMLSELRRVEERLQPFIQRAHTILETATTAEYNNNTVRFKQPHNNN